jgi:hypothetical protein
MRRMSRTLTLLAGLVAALVIATPAAAITNGQPDAGEHPYVGQLFFHDPTFPDPRFTDPGAWFNCSGTLISPTVVLTAGHCTFGTGLNGTSTVDPGEDGSGGNDVWVSFLATPDYTGIAAAPFIPDDNAGRYAHYRDTLNANPTWHRGTAYPHPQYDNDAFFLHDAGVVILDEPITMATYGKLPTLRYLDQFKGKQKQQLFEAVGYGLEFSRPKLQLGGDTRMKSQQKIVNFNGVYGLGPNIAIVFSNNNGSKHQGGTCSGDSGGPFLVNNTNQIVAVNSFGVPPNCTGNDGAYRVDQPDDLNWLAAVLAGRPR